MKKVWKFLNPVELKDNGKMFRAVNGTIKSLENYFGNARVYESPTEIIADYRGRRLKFRKDTKRDATFGEKKLQDLNVQELEYLGEVENDSFRKAKKYEKFSRVKELPDLIEDSRNGLRVTEKRHVFGFGNGFRGLKGITKSAATLGLAGYLAIAGLAAGSLTRDMIYYPAKRPDSEVIKHIQRAVDIWKGGKEKPLTYEQKLEALEELYSIDPLVSYNVRQQEEKLREHSSSCSDLLERKIFNLTCGGIVPVINSENLLKLNIPQVNKKISFLYSSHGLFKPPRTAVHNNFLRQINISDGRGEIGVLKKSFLDLFHETGHVVYNQNRNKINNLKKFSDKTFFDDSKDEIFNNIEVFYNNDIRFIDKIPEERYSEAFGDFIIESRKLNYSVIAGKVTNHNFFGLGKAKWKYDLEIEFLKAVHGEDFDKAGVHFSPGQVQVLYMPDIKKVWKDICERKDSEDVKTAKRLYSECLSAPFNVLQDVPLYYERATDLAEVWIKYKTYTEDNASLAFAGLGFFAGAGLAGFLAARNARKIYRDINERDVKDYNQDKQHFTESYSQEYKQPEKVKATRIDRESHRQFWQSIGRKKEKNYTEGMKKIF